MPPVDQQRSVTRLVPARGVLGDLAAASVIAMGVAAATWWLLGLPASYVPVAFALQGLLSGTVLWTLPADALTRGIGSANRVTLGRAALAVPVVALSLQPAPPGATARWWIIGLAAVVMALDGVDGRIARRTRTETAFGARFDMELDAVLILSLSILVWTSGVLAAWVLLIGGMRYLFVAASVVWPSLGSELPPSMRRKAVCVVQGVVLLVALGPPVPPTMAALAAGSGLAALCYSFAVDVRWALAHGRTR